MKRGTLLMKERNILSNGRTKGSRNGGRNLSLIWSMLAKRLSIGMRVGLTVNLIDRVRSLLLQKRVRLLQDYRLVDRYNHLVISYFAYFRYLTDASSFCITFHYS